MSRRTAAKNRVGFCKGDYDYRRMLERDDFDAVLLGTPAKWHAEMAIDSMNAGKHVASEVPGAYALDECWKLVDTKEKTGVKYMLLENYTYAKDRLMVYNMVHQGLLGECYYGECSYIHDCSGLRFNSKGDLTWRGVIKRDRYGNLYPTHSLGPVAKWMDINRGDVMVSLTSAMSTAVSLHAYAERKFGKDSEQAKIDFQCGDHCVTLIKTAGDKLITVYYDTDSPRPASIFYLIQGTEGVFDSREGVYVNGKSKSHRWDPASKYADEYGHDLWKKEGKRGRGVRSRRRAIFWRYWSSPRPSARTANRLSTSTTAPPGAVSSSFPKNRSTPASAASRSPTSRGGSGRRVARKMHSEAKPDPRKGTTE